MQNFKLRVLVLLVVALVAIPTFAQRRSALEQAERDAQTFGTFAELATLAGLGDVLNGDGPYTVLMPTNDSFNTFLTNNGLTLDDVKADPVLVRTLLDYHIISGEFSAADITAAYGGESDGVLELATLGGEELTIQVDPAGTVLLGGRGHAVFLPDQFVENGVIHAISGVLLPPSLTDEEGKATFRVKETIADLLGGAPEFTTLVQAVTDNGLLDALAGDGPITVFAPTNDAFLLSQSDMPEDIVSVLSMHVVPGRWTVQALGNQLALDRRDIGTLETLGGTTITYQLTADGAILLNGQGISTFVSDVVVDNGVIHYIGKVMIPQRDNTLGEYIRESSDFTLLETALDTVGLMDALDGEGPLTVLAPTDDAFERLASRLNITVDDMLANPDVLTAILQFHVLEGDFPSADIGTLYQSEQDGVLELTTLGGEELTLQVDDDENNTIILNRQGIDVFLPDVVTSNGRIHGLPGILIPPSLRDENGRPTFGTFRSIMDVLSRDQASFSSLVGLLEANGLAGTLSGTEQFTVFAPTNGALLTAQDELAGADVVSVLQFHIVPGRYTAEDLDDLFDLEADNILELTTISGEELWLQTDDAGNIILNAQGITSTVVNLSASNGVVHAISGVLLP